METAKKSNTKTREIFMRKIILEGILGEKFGYEWNLDIASPVEAIQAITSQRKESKIAFYPRLHNWHL